MVLQLALQILNNKEPVLFEGSNNYLRDFVYVNDVVQANLIYKFKNERHLQHWIWKK